MKTMIEAPATSPHMMSKPQSPLAQIHSLLQTLRIKKISMSCLHAVTSLYLNQDKRISLSDLATNLGITTAAITSVADTLERHGFAKRTINSRDRRHTHINLTLRGIAFAEWISETLGRQPESSTSARTSSALMAG